LEDSGGNPFYLQQLARTRDRAPLGPAASGARDELAELEVPPAVAAALIQELGLVSSRARRLLQGAAVVGDPFELSLATVAAGQTDSEALAALDELLALELVRRIQGPRRFRFRHPVVRRAVYTATPHGWRLAAHDRTARALAGRGDPPAARAHHLAQSAARGDRQAVALLREAADAAATRAPASAARWYQAALDLLPEGTEPEERVRLLGALAPVLAGSGQVSESRAALLELLELLELVPAEAAGARVKWTAACAGVEHLLGRHAQAHARLASALDQLPDQRSADAAALLLDLAADAYHRMDYQQMRGWALRARATAVPLGRAPLLAAAAASLSCVDAVTGQIDQALAHRAEAAAIIDALPDDQLALRLDAVSDLVVAEVNLDRYHDALAHARRGLAVGRATGQGQQFPQLTQAEGTALVDRAGSAAGQLEEPAPRKKLASRSGPLQNSRQSASPSLDSWVGLSVLQFRFRLVDRLLDGLPTLLVDSGRVLHDRMRKLRVDESAIMEAARELQGLERMDQVKYAVLERSGTITIVPADPG
jgi:tetratricopeptide (TPR) repeat protein